MKPLTPEQRELIKYIHDNDGNTLTNSKISNDLNTSAANINQRLFRLINRKLITVKPGKYPYVDKLYRVNYEHEALIDERL